VLTALVTLAASVAFAQQPPRGYAGRWQYLQPPDTEGEILDLSFSAGYWHGIMNGLERASEHGLFYYVIAVERLVVDPQGKISFEIGARSLFHARPVLSRLDGQGDGGFTRDRMWFTGRIEDGDLILRCQDESGSCPDSTSRFKKILEDDNE
jgi:hypothetical protein